MTLRQRVLSFLNNQNDATTLRKSTIAKANEALHVIEDAYRRYGQQGLAMSYNGGKDCLVLLVLLVTYLESLPVDDRPRLTRAVYVAIKDPFQEVDDFVIESAKAYHLDVIKIQKPMKEAFEDYLAQYPEIKAVLVGTRRNDPHGSNLTFFDETDGDWPRFMRVHPVINWEYAEVWDFLRALEIPYCTLYDRGYTSLGGKGDTLPNPSLSENVGAVELEETAIDEDTEVEVIRYRPAWQLNDGAEERRGRERARNTSRSTVVKINRRASMDTDSIRPE